MSDTTNEIDTNAVELATELTIAWLGNAHNRVDANEVPAFLNKMHETILSLSGGGAAATSEEPAVEYTPAVTVRKSLASPDAIISMIDGKPYKTLRRHLATHGLTPEQYRERYNLKADYPMVAPSYSAARQEMAKKIGLGRKPGAKVEPKAEAKPARGSAAKAAAKAHLSGE